MLTTALALGHRQPGNLVSQTADERTQGTFS
jgi:hypothetical protein